MNYKFQLLIFLAFLFFSCHPPNPLDIDVKSSPVSIQAERFDQALFSVDRNRIAEEIPKWRNEYGAFFDFYMSRILSFRNLTDSSLALSLKDFITHPDIKELHEACESKFKDVSDLENGIGEGFSHYKHYFPEKLVPKVVTFVSVFTYSIACGDSVIGIGLDMYLGNEFKYYAQVGLPNFKIRKMRREYIPLDALRGWAETEFEPKEKPKMFLEEIIQKGKILYFLDAMFPRTDDSLKIGYTAAQLEFCKKNESKIWSFFIDKKLLFSSSQNEYMKYISEGPTTNGLPPESPAMIGCWTGWQIVRKYMAENPACTLTQLMQENDAQKILTLSKYKPTK